MENLYSKMHNKYSLSKTLRFELLPIGKTKENIIKNGFLEKDEHRAASYKNVKKYCDEYHKYFIDKCLEEIEIEKDLLNEYYNVLKKENKSIEDKNTLKWLEQQFRTKIAENFKKDAEYKGLFGKEIITRYLNNYYNGNNKIIDEISEFKKFTTYFTKYNNNRENMYSPEEKSTSIAYRLINENLPMFLNNVTIYNKYGNYIREDLTKLENNIKEYLQINNLDEIFQVEYFNKTLTQVGNENYNIFISGKSLDDGTKIKGINEIINEYNQSQDIVKIPKMHLLYKQILSDKTSASFVLGAINDDKELVNAIKDYYDNLFYNIKGLQKVIENIEKYDLNKIYLRNNLKLTQLSKDVFDDWNRINVEIANKYDINYSGKNKTGTKKYLDEKKKHLKEISVYSISYLNSLSDNNEILNYIKYYIKNNSIIENINNSFNECKEILNREYIYNTKELIKDEKSIEKIKLLLDSIKKLQEFINILIYNKKDIEKDDLFYNEIEDIYNYLSEIIPLYNKVRNYLTQKPYSTEKIKLNFENSTFLNGWDKDYEKKYLGVLLTKDGNYYLGIINPNYKNIFDRLENSISPNSYKKMEYKLLPGPNKMLPKVFFSEKRISYFNPSRRLLEKYEKGLHKKGDNFDLKYCHELIDFYKKSIAIHEDWKYYNFKFQDTSSYEDISQFYRDVERQGYKIEFKNYSEEYINSLIETGDFYLFQIYCKDFSKYSKGLPNMHTLYWKALFDNNNFENGTVYQLNGNAEMFYRKSSLKLEDTAVHEKNKPVKNKNPLNKKESSLFEYDLIKNKRYTVDKFQIHVPITLNFNNEGETILNSDINEYLKNNDVNVIGIDRGERNLIYITVVNSKGKLLEQISLNEIVNVYNNQKIITNYRELLNEKEKSREQARESWKTIENIKELKDGYLSQVIHKIVELMDKYKAIIVLEDLNNGFKNSRIKVEKQVYQKFEKMLIEKLNYLVFKNKDINEEGGLFNAYQLTNRFESFNKLGKQSGVLFYIPAWCTSKIDPTTGFVNLINFKYESVEKSKELISKFDDIKFNKEDNYFEFYMDYSKFTNKSYGIRKDWVICTYGDRISLFRNKEKNNEFDYKRLNLTIEFKQLFDKYSIDYENLKESIIDNNEKDFWIELIYLLKLTYQMRNSISNSTTSEDDFIISPVKNKNNFFYDSRKANNNLPKDADANGAYNIARKGLMLIEQIRDSKEDNLNKIKFNITNDAWLSYVQEKDI